MLYPISQAFKVRTDLFAFSPASIDPNKNTVTLTDKSPLKPLSTAEWKCPTSLLRFCDMAAVGHLPDLEVSTGYVGRK